MSHPATNYGSTAAADALGDVLEVTGVKEGRKLPAGIGEDTLASDST